MKHSIIQKELAAELGLSPSFVSMVFTRTKRCPPSRAAAFERACLTLFGIKVPAHEWVFNKESSYPIFKGEVRNETQTDEAQRGI